MSRFRFGLLLGALIFGLYGCKEIVSGVSRDGFEALLLAALLVWVRGWLARFARA